MGDQKKSHGIASCSLLVFQVSSTPQKYHEFCHTEQKNWPIMFLKAKMGPPFFLSPPLLGGSW